MKTSLEILEGIVSTETLHSGMRPLNPYTPTVIQQAMKLYASQALDAAAEKVELGGLQSESGISLYRLEESILNLKNELK